MKPTANGAIDSIRGYVGAVRRVAMLDGKVSEANRDGLLHCCDEIDRLLDVLRGLGLEPPVA